MISKRAKYLIHEYAAALQNVDFYQGFDKDSNIKLEARYDLLCTYIEHLEQNQKEN